MVIWQRLRELGCTCTNSPAAQGEGDALYTHQERDTGYTHAHVHNVKILSQIYARVSDISRFHTSRDRRLAVSKGQDAQSFPGICFYQPICSLLD
jgi:hypothetical protein